MDINVLEKSKNKLVFEITGAGHTVCNALKDSLRAQSDVKIAAYTINHPLVGKPKMFVEMAKGDPVKALEKSVDDLKSKNKDFLKVFKKL